MEFVGEVLRVVVIIFGKGGVGKMIIIVNFGMCFVWLNFKVVVIDVDVGF